MDRPFGPYKNCWYCAAMEVDRLLNLLSDEVLRDIVCRLSSERYTPARLGGAMGVPEGQVLRRLATLRNWGMVRMVRRDSASTIVEPLPGEGAETLRRWAAKYCAVGDVCGRPVEKAQKPEGKRSMGSRNFRIGDTVVVNDRMQSNYQYKLVAPMGKDFMPGFEPNSRQRKCLPWVSSKESTATIARTNFPRIGSRRRALAIGQIRNSITSA